MFKKIISILLAVMMIMSLVTVMAASTGAVTYDDTKLYFDVSTTGWTLGSKDKVGFYIYGDGFEPIAWGGKKLNGVDEGDGIWSYDPASKGTTLEEGVQYKIIFTGAGQQTADLFFDTTCFGHCAYCNGEMVENTVDSSKKSQVALWKDLDPKDYGPVKGITSLGNLVGTCLPKGETDESMFTKWLTEPGAQGMKNAIKYTVEPGTKTCQKLIDDLATDMGLTKDFVDSAITENKTGIDAVLADTGLEELFSWSKDDSTIPGGHEHTPADPVRENVIPATCEEAGSYDEVVYCSECGEEISREANKVINPLDHDLKFVDEKAPTASVDGYKAHYECDRCHKLFDAEDQSKEVTAEEIAIKAEKVRGDANKDTELDITDVTTIQRFLAELITEDDIDKVAADADLDGELDIVDATLIQRVLLNICDWDKKAIAAS